MPDTDKYIAELEGIADRMAALSSEAEADDLKQATEALDGVIDVVHKSWSGSNIGYHARVYYQDYQTPPPDDMFNKEWGLMFGGEGRGWVIHADDDEVTEDIFYRAGVHNLNDFQARSTEAHGRFVAAKEALVSILSNYLLVNNDPYLSELQEKVRNTSTRSAISYARAYLPSADQMSRDGQAINQGLHVAPHQQILAQLKAILAPYMRAEELSTYARNAVEHLRRKPTDPPAAVASAAGSKVFVGHGGSPQWRELKDYIQDQCGLAVDEFNRVPAAGSTTIARLEDMLANAAIAFLVMTAEDENADGTKTARANVIHEVGLFQGRLGFEKAIVMLEEGCEEFSNIHGLIQVRYPAGNISAKFHEVRAILEREGLV